MWLWINKETPLAILNRFFDDLRLLPLAERSVLRDGACVRQLSEFFGKSPDLLSPEELRQYFLHRKTEKKRARQTSTQAICALKLFWEKTLRRPWPAGHPATSTPAVPAVKTAASA